MACFQQAFHERNRGSRLNDILAFGKSAAFQVSVAPKRPNSCDATLLVAVHHLNALIAGTVYCLCMYLLVPSLRIKGVEFKACSRSRPAANIIFKCQHFGDVPAKIGAIFLHNFTRDSQIQREVVLVVRRHAEFRPSDVQYDHYRQFDFFAAGGLYYERFGDLEVIQPTDILHHFAKTPYHPMNDEIITRRKVSSFHLASVGIPLQH